VSSGTGAVELRRLRSCRLLLPGQRGAGAGLHDETRAARTTAARRGGRGNSRRAGAVHAWCLPLPCFSLQPYPFLTHPPRFGGMRGHPNRKIYIFSIITIAARLILILKMIITYFFLTQIITYLLDQRSFNIGFAIFAHMTRNASTTRRCPVSERVEITWLPLSSSLKFPTFSQKNKKKVDMVVVQSPVAEPETMDRGSVEEFQP
jgi:hypothetical protein